MAFINGTFYALGYVPSRRNRGEVASSPDGINWTVREFAAESPFASLTYGNGLFVAAHYGGGFSVSTNGLDWERRPPTGPVGGINDSVWRGFSSYFQCVNGWFIATGNTSFVSPDLVHWQRDDSLGGSYFRWRNLILRGNGDLQIGTLLGPPFEVTLSATANASEAGEAATIVVRREGPLDIALPVDLAFSGTAGNGADYETIPARVFIPAGQAEVVLSLRPRADAVAEGEELATVSVDAADGYSTGSQASVSIRIVDANAASPRFRASAVRRAANGTVSLTLEMPATGTYQIETSSDLRTWAPLQAITATGGTVTIQDSSAGAADHRFYRLRAN
jgi:hypothetical protein